MAPTLLRGLKGVNISCGSPASTASMRFNDILENHQHQHQHGDQQYCRAKARVFNITPSFLYSKPKPQKQNGRKRSTSASDEKKSRTQFPSPSSSSRFLLAEDSSFADPPSYNLDVFPDFELDPVPEMIQIDSSRFHFSEGDGRLDLNSSASLSRPPKDHVGNYTRSSSTCAVTGKGSDWVRFDKTTELDDSEAEILRPSGVAATAQQEQQQQQQQHGFRASTSSWPPAAKEEDHQEEVDVLKKNKVVLTNTCAVDGGGPQEETDIGFRASTSSSSSSARVLRSAREDENAVLKSSFPARSRDQVVVLRVSLHCKGCEGKVRKHLSRMQGVTSFSIDFVAKKVTVVGEVTPLGVLSSVSKVKKAELWTSPTRPSSSATA